MEQRHLTLEDVMQLDTIYSQSVPANRSKVCHPQYNKQLLLKSWKLKKKKEEVLNGSFVLVIVKFCE